MTERTRSLKESPFLINHTQVRGALMAQLTGLKIALKIVGISDADLTSTYFFDTARQQLTADWVKYRFAYVISQTPAAKGVTPDVRWNFGKSDISDTDSSVTSWGPHRAA